MMLLPTAEPVASVMIFIIPMRMEQPYKENFQASSQKTSSIYQPTASFFFLSSSNVRKTVKMMHTIISFFVIFIA
jgi:hypothetical protein